HQASTTWVSHASTSPVCWPSHRRATATSTTIRLASSSTSRVSCCSQGFIYRPDRRNRRGPVPVYRSGLAGNRSVPVEFKFEFKKLSSTGSYRYTGRLDRFTGRFDRFEFKSKFKITCVTGLDRYTDRFDRFTGRFDRFTKWVLMG